MQTIMFSVFFKTINLWLSVLFSLSIATVLTIDLWFLDIEAPCKLFVALGKFNYGVAVSYIAAYIFYLITVHYPETRSSISVYTAASFPAKAVVTNIENIFVNMAKKQEKEAAVSDLTEETIKEILFGTKCYGDSTIYSPNLSPYNWIDYLLNVESTIRGFISQLKPLYPKMSGDYIAAISRVEQNLHFKPIKEIVLIGIKFGKYSRDDVAFGDGLEDMFLELFRETKSLEQIINETNQRFSVN